MDLINYKRPFFIQRGLKQEFAHVFHPQNTSKDAVTKMKIADKLTERDIDIALFLFKTRFATLNQVHRYVNNGTNKANFKDRMDKLVEMNILNRFIFTNFNRGEKTTLGIYCLDIGGRLLLENYSSVDTTEWYSSNNMKASDIIGQHLLATEWCVRLRESLGDNVLRFVAGPQLTCGKISLTPESIFTIGNKAKGVKTNFIMDVVTDSDFNNGLGDRFSKYDSIITTNAWKKYYALDTDAPILLLLVESEHNIPQIAKAITEQTRIKKIRFTTDLRMQNPLHEPGVFLKYDALLQQLTSGAIALFAPSEDE